MVLWVGQAVGEWGEPPAGADAAEWGCIRRDVGATTAGVPGALLLGVLLELHALIIESSMRQRLSSWGIRLSFGMVSTLARSRLQHFPFCSVFQEPTEDSA